MAMYICENCGDLKDGDWNVGSEYKDGEICESCAEELCCPECGSCEVDECHHEGNAAAPECDFKRCQKCNAEWDHQ